MFIVSKIDVAFESTSFPGSFFLHPKDPGNEVALNWDSFFFPLDDIFVKSLWINL